MRKNRYAMTVLTLHDMMGDATRSTIMNFRWNKVIQAYEVTTPSGTIELPVSGLTQSQELDLLNDVTIGENNPMSHEWANMYGVIGHCNVALALLREGKVAFSGADAPVKEKTYKAWFTYWKAFAYSRLGSMYSKVLLPDTYGKTNNNYQPYTAAIEEGQKRFQEAKSLLATINENDATYTTLMTTFIPSQMREGVKGGVLSPKTFIRNINTYMARNILVNTYAKDLTEAQLAQIEQLTREGVTEQDKILIIRSAKTNCFVDTEGFTPAMLTTNWQGISERLIQDFKPNDDRLKRNFVKTRDDHYYPNAMVIGSRYAAKDGGDYASNTVGLVEIPFGSSYEENALMLAEVLIRTGRTDDGLGLIDAVRRSQHAEMPAVQGTGLTATQALEELRSERRVGLFLKGVAFYDARRLGLLKPLSEGGGRHNANVVTKKDGSVEPCTIDYRYKERFEVPATETSYNPM